MTRQNGLAYLYKLRMWISHLSLPSILLETEHSRQCSFLEFLNFLSALCFPDTLISFSKSNSDTFQSKPSQCDPRSQQSVFLGLSNIPITRRTVPEECEKLISDSGETLSAKSAKSYLGKQIDIWFGILRQVCCLQRKKWRIYGNVMEVMDELANLPHAGIQESEH